MNMKVEPNARPIMAHWIDETGMVRWSPISRNSKNNTELAKQADGARRIQGF
jgi:hypothetical protein